MRARLVTLVVTLLLIGGVLGQPPAHAQQNWTTDGNDIDPTAELLGTTGAGDTLRLIAGGFDAFRIEPGNATIPPNLVGGHSVNAVTSGVKGATIGGGGQPDIGFGASPNTVADDFGTVGGGRSNRAGDDDGVPTDGTFATVSGARPTPRVAPTQRWAAAVSTTPRAATSPRWTEAFPTPLAAAPRRWAGVRQTLRAVPTPR